MILNVSDMAIALTQQILGLCETKTCAARRHGHFGQGQALRALNEELIRGITVRGAIGEKLVNAAVQPDREDRAARSHRRHPCPSDRRLQCRRRPDQSQDAASAKTGATFLSCLSPKRSWRHSPGQ